MQVQEKRLDEVRELLRQMPTHGACLRRAWVDEWLILHGAERFYWSDAKVCFRFPGDPFRIYRELDPVHVPDRGYFYPIKDLMPDPQLERQGVLEAGKLIEVTWSQEELTNEPSAEETYRTLLRFLPKDLTEAEVAELAPADVDAPSTQTLVQDGAVERDGQ